MRNRHARLRKLAASIVVTFAAAPGCKDAREPRPLDPQGCAPPDCHMNPPGIEPPATSSAPLDAATPPVATTTASASATASVPERVCYAPSTANCPPCDPKHPRTCNPPPPVRVPCP